MQENLVTYSESSGVATITLNRPQLLNALSLDAVHDLGEKLREAENSRHVLVVLLKGAGDKAFSAGADIRIFEAFKDAQDAKEFWRRTGPEIHTFIEKMTKPVIALISGYCLGGGLEIALSCDLVVATEDSKFGFPEINIGLIPGWGGTQRIARIVGRHRAKQLVMLGETIGADEALRIGLVNWVTRKEELDSFANVLVTKLKQKSSKTLAYAKDAANSAYELTLDQGLLYETELDTSLMSTEDTREGIRAFLEKRKPAFKSQI